MPNTAINVWQKAAGVSQLPKCHQDLFENLDLKQSHGATSREEDKFQKQMKGSPSFVGCGGHKPLSCSCPLLTYHLSWHCTDQQLLKDRSDLFAEFLDINAKQLPGACYLGTWQPLNKKFTRTGEVVGDTG